MSEQDARWQERRLDEILSSGADPVSKTQQIIRLGFDAEVADGLVERQQLGAGAPAYFESLRPIEPIADGEDVRGRGTSNRRP